MGYKNLEQQREYQRKWMAKRRQAWIQENGPCVDCGTWEDAEVDHVDASTKILPPSKLWSLSLTNPIRISELAKCVVRCTPCHKVKTVVNRERAHGINSGGASKYTDDQVLQIVALYTGGGYTKRGLARHFSVSDHTIRGWLKGTTRKYLER